MTFKDLCNRLRKFYWSDKHPSSYVICHPAIENRVAGIGSIAHECYAAFNLAYALTGKNLHTLQGQRAMVDKFTQLQTDCRLTQIVDGAELSDTILVLDQEAFGVWYTDNRQHITEACRDVLDKIYQTHEPVQHIRGT